MERKVAFVTGASRGIGKACAVALAGAGFDVAVSARTVHEGEAREHSSTVRMSKTTPLPGSLEGTAALVRRAGHEALSVPADLTDRASVRAAAERVLREWGRVDVLVNNGRYVGPGHMDPLLETPVDLLQKHVEANVLAPIVLVQAFLPGMVERGWGRVIDMTSSSAYGTPTKLPGRGGWGLGYGISKAALHRVAGFIVNEHGSRGVLSFNVQPGFTVTERIEADMREFGFSPKGAPPEVTASVVAWLATAEDAAPYSGRTIEAQFFCADRELLPGWAGPKPGRAPVDYDLSGAEAKRLEDELATEGRSR